MMDEAIVPPGFHVNEIAPLAVRVDEFPLHKGFVEAETDTVGSGFTTSAVVILLLQPAVLPVNV
jgi:hypothetical protein